MQYKVPQNVDIPDKVIGGLTLRQFMFLMVAGGIILMLKYVFIGPLNFLFLPSAIVIGGFGISLAFVKINDRPLEIFILSMGKTFFTPARRVWQKEVDEGPKKPEQKIVPAKVIPRKEGLGEIKSNLERLASIVDSGGVAPGDERITNIKPVDKDEPANLQDVIAETEKPSATLEKILEDAKKVVSGQKKEQPISSMSTTSTTEGAYKYDKLDLKNEADIEEMIITANQKEKDLEEKLDQATIKKEKED
jgi:hypothetical protein